MLCEELMEKGMKESGSYPLDKGILEDLSKNDTYDVFLKTMFPNACNKYAFRAQSKVKVISEMDCATVSNEAFTLLVLMNIWDTILDPNARPKFTNGSNKLKRAGSTSKCGGWSDEGM